jgi:hypothetical protein
MNTCTCWDEGDLGLHGVGCKQHSSLGRAKDHIVQNHLIRMKSAAKSMSNHSKTHILDLEIEEVLGEVCDELVLDVLGVELGHKAEGHRLHARHVLHKHLRNTAQQFSTTQPHHTTLT